jgi:hypothetical protein
MSYIRTASGRKQILFNIAEEFQQREQCERKFAALSKKDLDEFYAPFDPTYLEQDVENLLRIVESVMRDPIRLCFTSVTNNFENGIQAADMKRVKRPTV